jgi:hypothetical protein
MAAQRLVGIAETALGVVLAVTPVALWVAWTPDLLLGVMAAALAAAIALAALNLRWGATGDVPERPALPDEFVEQVHRLFPLTYHHSTAGPARFREAMARLSNLIAGKSSKG